MIRWLPLLLLGCGSEGGQESGDVLSITDFHGLVDGASWTYRDDGETEESPSDDVLLRSRYLGSGEIDMRRGVRWVDGPTEVFLVFDQGDQFVLKSWEMDGGSGSRDLPLGSHAVAQGQAVDEKNWFCRTVTRTEVETYYGVFDDVIQFQCEGAAGPEGNWTFAKDLGLVHYEGSDYTLNLVAPW